MLSLLVIHIITSLACIWSGFCVYHFIFKTAQEKSIIYFAITGLISLTTISQVVILFTPLSGYFQFLILILLTILILINRQNFLKFCRQCSNEIATLSLFPKLLLLIVWLIILLINSGPILMDDTESYHIQSIKWIKEYGTVPGLVNLHERYGFNSSWFSSVALFSFSNRFSSSYSALNGVLSLWLSYWFLLKFEQFRKENNINAVFAILITFLVCLFAWPLIRGNSATSNYDFVTTFVVLILFSQIFLSLRKEISVSFEWIILPAYLFTVRIMNFPLLLLSFFALIFFITQKNYKIFFLSITYCLLIIAPFLARNVIVAGLPFYPSTIFDWFNVDWKTDPQITESLREFIKYFNRVSTRYLDIEQTKALGSAWSATWYRYLSFFDKAIVLTGLAGFIFSTLRLFIDKNKYEIKSALVIAMSFVWLICWFLIAPDPRFVYGILLFGVFLLFYHLVSPFENLEKIKRLPNIVMIIIIGGLVFYLISKSRNQKEYQNWALPAKLPEPPTQQIMIDGITFRIPERINNNWNARCYGSELPCLYIIHPRLRVRGKNIRNGFHLEK